MNEECDLKKVFLHLTILTIIVFTWFFIIYFTAKNKDWIHNDFLNKKVFEWNFLENCCSWWPITHYISFTILSFLNPNCGSVLFTAGVSWEIFEVFMNYLHRGSIEKHQVMRCDTSVQYNKVWWAGSFKDIFFNTMGIITGKLLYFFIKTK